MSEEKKVYFLEGICILLLMLISLLGFIIISLNKQSESLNRISEDIKCEKQIRDEAVQRGYATWETEDGVKVFRWKDNENVRN